MKITEKFMGFQILLLRFREALSAQKVTLKIALSDWSEDKCYNCTGAG